MSIGTVRDLGGQLFLILPIYIEGPNGVGKVYFAYIDTGFTNQLAIPATMREDLELEYIESVDVEFGNAQVEKIDTYRATVFWNNDWQQITVLETGDRPLIGMNLLRGSNVCFDAIELGEIGIEPLTIEADDLAGDQRSSD